MAWRRLGEYTGWDMALASGKQSFRVMLPHLSEQVVSQSLAVRALFVTRHGDYDLGQQWLAVADQRERACVVGSLDLTSAALVRSLQLERYDPGRPRKSPHRLHTFLAAVPSADFPVDPLGYCAYDVVVLPAVAFGLVHQRQLDALLAWVRAGGSVCVLPGEGQRKPYQDEFLKALAGGAAPGEDLEMFRCGLGRAVIAAAPGAFDTPAWRRAVGFLWKVRGDQLDALANNGLWRPEFPDRPMPDDTGAGLSLPRTSAMTQEIMGVQPLSSAVNFYQPLMPRSLRPVPTGWIAVLLLLLVLAVGPGDYVLLGAIRRRKLTWVLFPALCIGFTLCMVAMARHYLGTNQQRAAYVFVDLGEGGRVLRTSRYDLVYSAGESTVSTRYRDVIASPLDPSMFVLLTSYYQSGLYYPHTQMSEQTPPSYAGRLPGNYVVRRRRQQWVPQLTRTLQIGGDGPDLGLHWDAVTVEDLRSKDLSRISRKLTGGGPFDGDVCVANGRTFWRARKGVAGVIDAGVGTYNRTVFMIQRFLDDVSSRPATGFFAVVSQVSPNGAGNFEDLGMLDPTDPDQWRADGRSARGRRLRHLPPSLQRRTVMAFVEIKHLFVMYGRTVAVKNLSFDIPQGEVFGFIGPNGAGKTTTIKVLATLLRPTGGTASIGGTDVTRRPAQGAPHDRLHARLLRRLRGPDRQRVPALLRGRLPPRPRASAGPSWTTCWR